MKNMNNFCYAKEVIMCYYYQIKTFAVSKDEQDTKEDTDKSIKNAQCMYCGSYAYRAEVTKKSSLGNLSVMLV